MSSLRPPEKFQCVPGPKQTVACSWAPPIADKVFIAYSYRLYCKKSSNAKFERIFEVKDEFQYTAKGLEPNVEYDFKLMSFTANCPDGPCAPIVTLRTGAAGPSVTPTNLREAYSNTDTLVVEWDLPATSDPIKGFRVFMDEEGYEQYTEEDVPPTVQSYRCTYLRMDTMYRFQVLAFNEVGEGPMSLLLRARTQQDAVSRFLQRRRKPDQVVSFTKQVDIRGERAPVPEPEPEPEKRPEPRPSKGNMPFVPSVERRPRPSAFVAAAPPPEPEPDLDEKEAAKERRRKMSAKNFYVDEIVLRAQAMLNSKKVFVADPPMQVTNVSKGVVGVEPTSAELMMMERLREREALEQQLAMRSKDSLLPLGYDDPLLYAGTIRGKKNAVRTALGSLSATKMFESELLERLYNEEKDGKIVVYTTSVQAVRKTYEDCRAILKVFEILKKKIQIKDVALDPRFNTELEERLGDTTVPQVFINATYIGGLAVITELNESSDLKRMLEPFENRSEKPCGTCGGIGYYNCTWCQGSKRSLAHTFEKDPRKNALKCTVCNENGLQKCGDC